MGGEPAGFREAKDNRLGKLVGVEIAPLFGDGKARGEGAGGDDPADAEAGKGDFGEAAKVDDIGGIVQLLEGREGFAFVAEFAVGIVFDEDRPGLTDSAENREARREGESEASRILEIGGQDDGAGAFAFHDPLEIFDVEALETNGDTEEASAGLGNRGVETGVDRIFDDDGIAGTDEDAMDEVESLLAAAGDDDVVGVAGETAFAGPFEKIVAKRGVTGGRAELEDVGGAVAVEHFLDGRSKLGHGEQIFGGTGGREADGCRGDGGLRSGWE